MEAQNAAETIKAMVRKAIRENRVDELDVADFVGPIKLAFYARDKRLAKLHAELLEKYME